MSEAESQGSQTHPGLHAVARYAGLWLQLGEATM
jgi:hypothetical protein